MWGNWKKYPVGTVEASSTVHFHMLPYQLSKPGPNCPKRIRCKMSLTFADIERRR